MAFAWITDVSMSDHLLNDEPVEQDEAVIVVFLRQSPAVGNLKFLTC